MNRRDPDAFLACLHPDVAWEESGDVFPGLRGTYHGHAEARRWFEEALVEVWDSFHLKTEAITDAGDDRVLLEALFTARGTTSGVETELRFWTVLWFADGKIARRQIFWTGDEALEATGVQEEPSK